MPVGKCQEDFRIAAARDGIALERQSFDWLCEQGHFGLLRVAEHAGDEEIAERARSAAGALAAICRRLGGDPDVISAGRTNRLPGDFVHAATGTLIEIDEEQHFTSFRRGTFEEYPEDTQLGYDLDGYKRLCRTFAGSSDRYRKNKEARGFGVGGRQLQRAYYDALRDLATPAMGHPPLVRIPATHGDGKRAYRENRARLRAALVLDND